MKALWRKIDRFWCGGIDDRVYGCIRLSFATVALLNLVQWWGCSDELLSSAGFNSMASAAESGPWAVLSLFAFLRDPLLIKVALVLFGAAHVLLFLGVASRACLLVSFYWHFSYLNWAVLGTAGWDMILGNVCFVLLLSPTGRSVRPLDWLRSPGSRSQAAAGLATEREVAMSPRYGVYMLRIEVFLIYWLTVVTRFPDPYWQNGDFFGYYLLSDFSWLGGPWVLEAGWLLKAATWGTQALEVAIPLLLVFRRTWVLGFALGTLFHLSLAVMTTNLVLFSLSMVMVYTAFIRFPVASWTGRVTPPRLS
jgi:hypothetical protein